MFLIWLSVAIAWAAAIWVWRNRPHRVLARLEGRYNLVVPRHRLGEVSERLHLLGLRLDTRFIEAACQARALAGRVLKRPAAFQKQVDELTLRKAGPAVMDQLLGLIIRDLLDAAKVSGRQEECSKLELHVYGLLKDFRRYGKLREGATA